MMTAISPHDVEARLALCLSIVDQRFARRDRLTGEARAALDGASIDQILEARGA